jgi:hypothetical protein
MNDQRSKDVWMRTLVASVPNRSPSALLDIAYLLQRRGFGPAAPYRFKYQGGHGIWSDECSDDIRIARSELGPMQSQASSLRSQIRAFVASLPESDADVRVLAIADQLIRIAESTARENDVERLLDLAIERAAGESTLTPRQAIARVGQLMSLADVHQESA